MQELPKNHIWILSVINIVKYAEVCGCAGHCVT